MKKFLSVLGLVSFMAVGCSGAFWTGAGGGTAATGVGYEVNAKTQMDRITKDLAAGRIDHREYDIRKDQIKRMSLAY